MDDSINSSMFDDELMDEEQMDPTAEVFLLHFLAYVKVICEQDDIWSKLQPVVNLCLNVFIVSEIKLQYFCQLVIAKAYL